MANAAGMLKESIWRDKDFRALPRNAQATYCELISQKDLDRAGVQPLQVAKWAKGCDEITDADIETDLKVLEAHRFVFIDEDTDEAFIRSYMRHCEVVRYPNILKNALRCATMVASEKIRRELAAELRRLRKADATRVADQIDPDPPNPSETKANPSETVPEGLNGSETLTEPQGYGTGSGYGSISLVSGQVGEGPQKSQLDKTDPPSQFCSKHPDGTDRPCGPCRNARRRAESWHDNRAAAISAANVRRRQEIRDCDGCDENGLVVLGDLNATIRCPKHDWSPQNA